MKLLATVFFALFSFSLCAQAPVNDDCSGIIDLGILPFCSAPAQYTNVGATTSNIDPVNNVPACFANNAERDVWFQFTVPADGSITDITISIFGNVNGNGTLQMPQVAIYRGDCDFGQLAELDCASAPLNVNELHLDQFGLTPGLTYFLRINDYSATAAANAGTFKLCVEKYIPEINIGTVAGSQTCTGTLFDTGGPNGDYASNDDDSFTICPTDFHQCIILNVVTYETEAGFDYLQFFQGSDINSPQITQISGTGQNFEVQVPGSCATVRFSADFSGVDSGFELTWACSPTPCTTPPITTCADPVVIPTLPYDANDLSNCLSGNAIGDGPCDDDFLSGNDYVFAYTSLGDECIHVSVTGTNDGAGIGIYSLCPSLPGSTCIATAGGGFGTADPTIQAAFLENPGTYYLVFGSGDDCSPFNISVDTITCPVVLPAASSCETALNIGGCSNQVPEVIALDPGAGDPDFLQPGVNAGCFLTSPGNFSFFYFTAGADGKFGFVAQAADPNESSDIDFSVWGPIDNVADICDYVTNNQPVRSSWAAYENINEVYITGLADEHPTTGLPVNDNFDCGSPATPGVGANADDFVKRLDVQEGKIYVILLDDFGNAIEQGGIAMDFTGTAEGVLDALESQITVSADTAVCSGQPVQLHATGGVSYFWSPEIGLSCTHCPDPLATINISTTYQVQIVSTCQTVTRSVDVKALDIDLGPDITVCGGASFTLNPHPFAEVQYTWIGAGLSCNNCPSPVVSGLPTGVYTFVATLSTPQCVKSDTIQVVVVTGQQPQYTIADDQVICNGESVSLGGASVAGNVYVWTSNPPGFTSLQANPTVTPNTTTTYYLSATNGSCPVPVIDSVQVTVYQSPIVSVQPDTSICDGASVLLSTTVPQTGVTYSWTPNDGSLDNPASATPIAMPLQTTTYTLTASNPGCTEIRQIQVTVAPLTLQLNVPDSTLICLGSSVSIQATVSPTGPAVIWTPTTDLQITANGSMAVATPTESTLYTAQVTVPGCTRVQQLYIAVDSLPHDLSILPADTMICVGGLVLLQSPIYEPADFKNIEFQWLPFVGQLTGDSLYNLVVQPPETTTYQRITRNGGCVDTTSATVTVIPLAEMQVVPADTTICPGQPVQLHLTYTPGVTEIMWMPATTLTCSDCDNPIATPTATTTYNVSGKFQGCVTGTSATINVLPTPAYQFPGDRTLCSGESITLNETVDPTATYTWTSTDPTFGTFNGPQPVVSPTQTTTYFLTASNAGGCFIQDQLIITVINGSVQAFGDTTLCKGAVTQISATSTIPGTFQWDHDLGTGPVKDVSPTESTTYIVTFAAGDCQLTDSVRIEVSGENPVAVFPNDIQLCPGESITLNDSITPGATYVWSSVPGGFSSSLPTPTVTPTQNTTYTVQITSGECINTQSVNVIVHSGVTLTVSNDTTVCTGQSVKLVANGSTQGTFTWTPGGTTGSMITVNPNVGLTSYLVRYVYGDSCILRDSVQITASPNFMADLIATPDTNTINLGESIDLFGKVSPSQNLTGFQYHWLEGENMLNFTTEMVTVKPETEADSVIYTVEITSPAGCKQKATLSFRIIQPLVKIPNAFTPNGDQVNGTFKPVVLEGVVTIERMEIYNRWGQKVFESVDPAAVWDGRVDGKDAPSDVYAYVIRYRRGDGALKIEHGEVNLLR